MDRKSEEVHSSMLVRNNLIAPIPGVGYAYNYRVLNFRADITRPQPRFFYMLLDIPAGVDYPYAGAG